MAIIKTLLWIYRECFHLGAIFEFCGLYSNRYSTQIPEKVRALIAMTSGINLWYYKFQKYSYIELYQACFKERTFESYLVFFARICEILSHVFSVYLACKDLKNESNDTSYHLFAEALAFFFCDFTGVLQPAIYGYKQPKTPNPIKPSPKTSSSLLPKQPTKHKTQQQSVSNLPVQKSKQPSACK